MISSSREQVDAILITSATGNTATLSCNELIFISGVLQRRAALMRLMQGAEPACLVVFWREVGNQRGRVLIIPAVDMAQHDCLVKCLGSCSLTIMTAKVLVLARHSDVALPLF